MSHNNIGSSGSIPMKLFPVDVPRISSERIVISKVGKKTIINYNPFRVGPKNLANFGPQTTELKWLILTNPSGHFSGDYISAIRGCCPSNVYTH